jgi:nucleoside-diphosphate-sugar epimerase
VQVLIGGASGAIGSALRASLSVPKADNRFHPEVFTLVRSTPRNDRYLQQRACRRNSRCTHDDACAERVRARVGLL